MAQEIHSFQILQARYMICHVKNFTISRTTLNQSLECLLAPTPISIRHPNSWNQSGHKYSATQNLYQAMSHLWGTASSPGSPGRSHMRCLQQLRLNMSQSMQVDLCWHSPRTLSFMTQPNNFEFIFTGSVKRATLKKYQLTKFQLTLIWRNFSSSLYEKSSIIFHFQTDAADTDQWGLVRRSTVKTSSEISHVYSSTTIWLCLLLSHLITFLFLLLCLAHSHLCLLCLLQVWFLSLSPHISILLSYIFNFSEINHLIILSFHLLSLTFSHPFLSFCLQSCFISPVISPLSRVLTPQVGNIQVHFISPFVSPLSCVLTPQVGNLQILCSLNMPVQLLATVFIFLMK
ncbi:hypothetical protein VP01_1050g6 [Puccinia sorghi]|uniref:Uncharacterized protein n=1 Tax=Puccinia sorghi TaxID=27349 RepID=A0A0L6VUE1_9BASI|nr:hypothetical protein VP01_1050g6 [Puccinia sorghi]